MRWWLSRRPCDLPADTGRWCTFRTRASMRAGLYLLEELGFALEANGSAAVRAAQSLGGHHGRFLQTDLEGAASCPRVQATLGGPAWQELRRRCTRVLWHPFNIESAPAGLSVEAAVLITGLTMVADRLASRRRYWVPNAHAPSFGANEHYGHARRQAGEEVERVGLARLALDRVAFTVAHAGLEAPDALQASVLEELPRLAAERGSGIAVVTDATGAGTSVTALERHGSSTNTAAPRERCGCYRPQPPPIRHTRSSTGTCAPTGPNAPP
ncbi:MULTISPECIES: HD domain-containing protein [unclassified Streptomyces]|uniref:HD domain-containing protein n=1 Tax=Streptomyces sp. NPDC127532 TaxID=3345399 RepID=UPI00363B466C